MNTCILKAVIEDFFSEISENNILIPFICLAFAVSSETNTLAKL